MAANFALVALAATLFTAVAGVGLLARGRSERRALIQRSTLDEFEGLGRRIGATLDGRLRATSVGNRLGVRLAAAGVEMRPVDFLFLAGCVVLAAFVVAEAALPTWMAVAAAAAAAWAARAWVQRKHAQRRDQFVAQLPDLARVLANAASAGLAIPTGIEMAASELDDPGAAEMRRLIDELRIGQSLDGALKSLERRMPSREVGVLTSTLVIHQRAGGSLVRALSEMAETLDDRKELAREVRTAMAGSVYTGYLVAVMGLGSVLLLNLISPGLLDEMTSSRLGQIAFVVAGLFYMAGLVAVRRVTRIET